MMKKPAKKKQSKATLLMKTKPAKLPTRAAIAARKTKTTKPKEKPPVNIKPPSDTRVGVIEPKPLVDKLTVVACSTNTAGQHDVLLSNGETVVLNKAQHPGDEYVPEPILESVVVSDLKAQIAEKDATIDSLNQRVVDLQRAADEARAALDAVSASKSVGVAPPASTEALGKTGDLPVHMSMEDMERKALAEAGVGMNDKASRKPSRKS